MAATGNVVISIVGDVSNLKSALGQADTSMSAFEQKMQRIGDSMVNIGKKMTVGISLPIAAVGVASVKAASDLEQSIGATESVFGDAIETIDKFAEKSVDAVGLSERAYRELAAVAGAQLKNLGLSQEAAAEGANKLIKIGADLAATFGGTTREAVEALGAAFRGEADPAERFGLRLNINTANAKAVALGLAESTSQVSDFARQQAIMTLIVEQSGGAMGQFARESDTLGVKMQKANAELENAAAELGGVLLPIVAEVVGVVASMASAFQGVPKEVQTLVVVLGGLAAAAGPVLVLTGSLIRNWQTLSALAPTLASGIGRAAAGLATFAASYQLTTIALHAIFDVADKITPALEKYAQQVEDIAKLNDDQLVPALNNAATAYIQAARTRDDVVVPTRITASLQAFKDLLDKNADAAKRVAEQYKDQPGLYQAMQNAIAAHDRELENLNSTVKTAEELFEEYHDELERNVSASFDSQGAAISMDRAIADLNETMKKTNITTLEGRDALLQAEERVVAFGQAIFDEMEPIRGFEQATRDQIGALEGVRDSLAPGSPLRAFLDQYIERLRNGIPRNIDTHVAIHVSRTGDPGIDPNTGERIVPIFAGGGIVPGPLGSPQLAVVHGGERIWDPLNPDPAMAAPGGGGGPLIGSVTIVAPDPESAADALTRRLRTEAFLAGMN